MPAKALPAAARLRRPSPDAIRRIARFLPSRRSLAIGAGVIALAAAGYAIARETSLFAIGQVDVAGGSPSVDAQVERALASFVGKSLVGLDGGAMLQRIDALPTVVSATYDRAFPSTLRVRIVPERPVAVLRDGAAAWIVSERGRVMRPVAATAAPTLPRIWAAKKDVRLGVLLSFRQGAVLTRALTAAGPLGARITTASFSSGQVVFHLRSGLELVLGSPSDVALKVAVAAQVLRQLPSWTRVVDVSVPSRPVTSTQSSSG